MTDQRVSYHFGFGYAGVKVVGVDYLPAVFVPGSHIVDPQLHHEILGPFLDVIILKAKFRTAELAIDVTAPCLA